MALQESVQTIDGRELKLLFKAGVSWVSQHVDAINRMNVFPVPDGDTGINMYHTLKRAYDEISEFDTQDANLIAGRFAQGALMGARGNSGTILSQILRGFAEGLGNAETIHPQLLLTACEKSVEFAYQSVNEPVEGTILTVAREAFEGINQTYEPDMTLDVMLDRLTSQAEQSLYNTPNLLPILKDAGVVDSGGMGLFFFIQGMTRFKDGESVAEFVSTPSRTSEEVSWETALTPDDEEGYGYDVQFLMYGNGMDVKQIRSEFENMGWSVLVVGDESLLKVHIHVHNPADPFNYAIGLGVELDDIVVENMHRQYQGYVQARQHLQDADYQIPTHGIAVVGVVSGEGISAVYNDLNCTRVIRGGQTMNPSTEDFLTVINDIPTNKIIILPNNSNIILTAQQTAQLATDKDVRVIPTKSVMQGISALIAYGDEANPDITFDEMVANMTESLEYVRSVEVTRSIRSVELDGKAIVEGHYMGIVDGKIKATGETLEETLLAVFNDIDNEDYELATLYYGDEVTSDATRQLIERLSNAIKGLEFEAVYGGQPLYPYLISVE